MNRRERVLAALVGEAVDRVPMSIWYHFGTQHLPGPQAAEIHAGFLAHYDLDWLKVMNDYRYPLPAGLEEFTRPADWGCFEPLDLSAPHFKEQLALLRHLRSILAEDVPFVDTVFNPFSTALRVGGRGLYDALREDPAPVLAGLEVITDNLVRYVQAVLETGAAGIFLSINAGANEGLVSEEEYERFVRPFDLRILEAAAGGVLNILHAHGERPMFAQLAEYPCHAVNWSHHNTPPSLAEARRLTDSCLIGGVDEVHGKGLSIPQMEAQVREALQEAGARKFMVGPGCAVATDVAPGLIHAVRRASAVAA